MFIVDCFSMKFRNSEIINLYDTISSQIVKDGSKIFKLSGVNPRGDMNLSPL